MALAYNVWTEEEITSRNIVEKGNYPFEILAAQVKKTKGGLDKDGNQKPIRDMLEIEYNFWDQNGVIKRQRDWIVFMEGMDWKLRHLANSIGLLELYEQKALEAHHLLRKQGVFELDIKEFEGKKSNFVVDYVKKAPQEKVINTSNSDIPF